MTNMTINRRGLLSLCSARPRQQSLPGCATTISRDPVQVQFAHGVASGDPAADGAVIWTRVSTDEARG